MTLQELTIKKPGFIDILNQATKYRNSKIKDIIYSELKKKLDFYTPEEYGTAIQYITEALDY